VPRLWGSSVQHATQHLLDRLSRVRADPTEAPADEIAIERHEPIKLDKRRKP
jgi:hypothetical protein